MAKIDKGVMKGADPTAPGGMSQKALAQELISRHGWTKDSIREARLLDLAEWPRLIDAVCQARLDREREVNRLEREDPLAEYEEATTQPLFVGMPTTRDYIFDGHAGISPSGAERWLSCTESPGMIRRFLETLSPIQREQLATGSVAARQGTTAHAVGEAKLLNLLDRASDEETEATLLELTLEPPDGEEYTEEMDEHVTEYVDLVRLYAQDRGNEHVLIEQRVEAIVPLVGDHEDETHTISGSTDVGVLPTEDEPELVVGDLKFGAGVDVSVERNPQLRTYALGLLDLLIDDEGNLITDVQKVTYIIAQPRLGGVKVWSESLDDLLDWRDDVLSPALTAALYGRKAGAVFAPSDDVCQWCPAKGTCSALTKQRVEAASDLFTTITEAEFEDGPGAFPETDTLDDEALGHLLAQVQGLTKIEEDLRAEAHRRMCRGKAVPGYKLVSYTPPRAWSEKAREALAKIPELWKDPTLVTPTQALKVLKEDEAALKKINRLITSPDKKPVLAPESSNRKTWEERSAEDMFPETGADDE